MMNYKKANSINQEKSKTQECNKSELTRLLGGRKITDLTEFNVPKKIATCVDCNSKLTAEVDGWTIADEGENLWMADSVTPWCSRWRQCVEQQRFASQADVIMNQRKILNWLNENYRWQFEAT